MKRNVDLTENRFFSSNSIFQFNDAESIALITDEDLNSQIDAIIAVGNRETRKAIQFYQQIFSADYCDCCGKRMNLKPWDKEFGICHKCNNDYSKEEDKCKWRIREVIRNASII